MDNFFENLFYIPDEFWMCFFLILGLILGSFANVIILRLPKNLSVISPRSSCPHCHKLIRFYDNIPLFSWFFLRGKCRCCGAKISWKYPVVELVMGLIFLGLYLKIGLSWVLLEYYIFSFSLVVVSFIDFDHYYLPDGFTLSGILIGLLGAYLNPDREFLSSFLGFLMGGGFLWAVAYFYFLIRKEEGMGGGDIKLLAWIGAVLGWESIAFVIIISSVLGGLIGLICGIKEKKGLQTKIAFGPYLALAAIVYIFLGREISQWYINLFIPGII